MLKREKMMNRIEVVDIEEMMIEEIDTKEEMREEAMMEAALSQEMEAIITKIVVEVDFKEETIILIIEEMEGALALEEAVAMIEVIIEEDDFSLIN